MYEKGDRVRVNSRRGRRSPVTGNGVVVFVTEQHPWRLYTVLVETECQRQEYLVFEDEMEKGY